MPLRMLPYAFIAFLSLCFTVQPSLAASSTPEQNTEYQYIKTLDFIHSMGKMIYCYWDLKKEAHQVDWDQLVFDAKRKININTSLEDFQNILTQLAASLHDGHVNYIPKAAKRTFYLPVEVTLLDDEYYISNVDTQNQLTGHLELAAGDKLLAVNGREIHDYIEEKSKNISGSTAKNIKLRAALSINSLPRYKSAPEGTVTLTVEKFSNQEIKNVELPWLIYKESSVDDGLSDIVKSKILPGNIAVLSLRSMHNKAGNKAFIHYIRQEMEALQNTNALIIDVRNNGGGYGEIGDSVIAHFISQQYRRYQAQMKNSVQVYYARPELLELFADTDPSVHEYSEWHDYMIEPLQQGKKTYSKPVYILTNARCFSACDTFVDSFSSNHLGEVLGQQTGGGTGYPLWIDLPWGLGHFRFSVLRGYSNHDRYLEGIGTLPDVEISATPRDLYLNLDGEMLKAHRYVLSKLNRNTSLKQQDLQQYFKKTENKMIPYAIEEEHLQKIQSER